MKSFLLLVSIIALALSACGQNESPKIYAAKTTSLSASPVTPVEPGSVNSGLPVQLQVVGRYNIVKFKGTYYACPHGQEINWEKDDAAKLPGVLVADTQEGLLVKVPR